MKLGELVKSRDALVELNNSKKLDVVTAYKISKNIKNINEELKVFEIEQGKLINKYCEKDSEGNPLIDDGTFSILGENVRLYEKELEKLYDVEVDVKIQKIHLNLLQNVCLSPAQIGTIEYMIQSED